LINTTNKNNSPSPVLAVKNPASYSSSAVPSYSSSMSLVSNYQQLNEPYFNQIEQHQQLQQHQPHHLQAAKTQLFYSHYPNGIAFTQNGNQNNANSSYILQPKIDPLTESSPPLTLSSSTSSSTSSSSSLLNEYSSTSVAPGQNINNSLYDSSSSSFNSHLTSDPLAVYSHFTNNNHNNTNNSTNRNSYFNQAFYSTGKSGLEELGQTNSYVNNNLNLLSSSSSYNNNNSSSSSLIDNTSYQTYQFGSAGFSGINNYDNSGHMQAANFNSQPMSYLSASLKQSQTGSLNQKLTNL
jgi:hypothetical protein